MKILHLPDLHCYWSTYEDKRENEKPTRLAEWQRVSDAAWKIAVANNVSLVLAPGDFYRHPKPDSEAVNSVLEFFSAMGHHGIDIVGCSGNHDYTKPRRTNFVTVVGRTNYSWGLTQPTIVTHCGYEIAVLPFGKYKQEELIAKFKELEAMVQTDKAIFMGHWATDKSTYVNGTQASEISLPLDLLKNSCFKICALGHIHKPQILCENPLILHAGVMTRQKSDEGTVPCGAYMIDSDTLEYKFMELPARAITVVRLTNPTGDFGLEIGNLEGSYVKVEYDIEEEHAAEVDNKAIVQDCYDKGAFFVEGVYPNVIRKARVPDIKITESMTEVEMFNEWYRKQYGKEPSKDVTDIMEGIINKVR